MTFRLVEVSEIPSSRVHDSYGWSVWERMTAVAGRVTLPPNFASLSALIDNPCSPAGCLPKFPKDAESGMVDPDGDDNLDDTWRDKLVAVGKAAAGMVPFIGGPLAEIVGSVVPGQRADRIATYLRQLSQRIDAMEQSVQAELTRSKEKINLIEEGGFQAARALSAERIGQIVHAVAEGISHDEADLVRRKRILAMLSELDEDEIGLLRAYDQAASGVGLAAFESTNRPPLAHLRSPVEERDRHRLYEAGREHLMRLGMLQKHYPTVQRGEEREFDARTGDFRHSIMISYLGRMLLRDIGLSTGGDPWEAQ